MARLTIEERRELSDRSADFSDGVTAADRNAARRRLYEDDEAALAVLAPLHLAAAEATNVVTIISPTPATEEEFVSLRNALVAQMAYLSAIHTLLAELAEGGIGPYQEPETLADDLLAPDPPMIDLNGEQQA